MLLPSQYQDGFSRTALPPLSEWPELKFDLPELQFPALMNCADELIRRGVELAGLEAPAIVSDQQELSYADLQALVNRICHVLIEDCDLKAGERVLLRGANTPELLASWLALVKSGGIAVTTMPMLRAGELRKIIEIAAPRLALCEHSLAGELELCHEASSLKRIVEFGEPGAELEQRLRGKPTDFTAFPASQDDVCLIAFTSGTTGQPKAAMHFHRDVLAICHTFAAHRLPTCHRPVFSGTPPLGFTFGLGALLLFPLFFGGSVALPAPTGPQQLAQAVRRFGITHLFTSPTAYRAMLEGRDLSLPSLKVAVAAGEHLPPATAQAWHKATGIELLNGLGATEMLHIFLSTETDTDANGGLGTPVPGFTAALVDADGQLICGPGEGRLVVKGPVGCRYLNDARQSDYVVNGWNVTGDIFRRDALGRFYFVSRADDIIVSSGYNIAAVEVEQAVLGHPAVRECAVIGVPDAMRGKLVKALIVPEPAIQTDDELIREIQDFVKNSIAPYKYPRAIEFVAALPRTVTGKISRKHDVK
jgi:2-aminobenzoate-CoA ligase